MEDVIKILFGIFFLASPKFALDAVFDAQKTFPGGLPDTKLTRKIIRVVWFALGAIALLDGLLSLSRRVG